MAVPIDRPGASSVYTSTLWPTSLLRTPSALPAPVSERGCGCDWFSCSILPSYIVTPPPAWSEPGRLCTTFYALSHCTLLHAAVFPGILVHLRNPIRMKASRGPPRLHSVR